MFVQVIKNKIYTLFVEDELAQAKQQAEKQAKDMQLNVVKLCFQAYLKDGSNLISKVLPSVLSSPIYDSSKFHFDI